MLRLLLSGYVIWIGAAIAQDASDGRKIFEALCGVCHGGDANGGEFAGSVVARVAASTDAQLSTTISSTCSTGPMENCFAPSRSSIS
jgi:mono/diheme cytochrome c family protein